MEDQRGWMTGQSVAVWLLEEFDRSTGAYRGRHRLAGLSDAEVRSWVELERLDGDLYDVPDRVLTDIPRRYGIPVFPERIEYLISREAGPTA
ncbi:hypothetical protein ACF06X_03605 [Streptomyces sp. NPDC015346]|uniref:hypothetical protein n=1 Tax=Streptomyces sp. NPDC015346 TaxID=3364954 RepID=UPI0036FF134C